MPTFRVDVQAAFTVPKKQNAESVRDTVIKMIRESGFEEKEFIIKIDKTELVEGLQTPALKEIDPVKEKKEKKIIVKRRKTRKSKVRNK
jgi:hypothetical protein